MKQKTYCGLNYKQLSDVMTTMSGIEELNDLNDYQRLAFDISIQCVTEVMNRMRDDKPIEFEVV